MAEAAERAAVVVSSTAQLRADFEEAAAAIAAEASAVEVFAEGFGA